MDGDMRKTIRRAGAAMLAAVLFVLFAGYAAAAGGKLIAFTFDDGPGEPTGRLLDGLQERGVKVTFFMLGSCAEDYPNTVARAYREGHQIALHSYSHARLDRLSDGDVQNEFSSTARVLKELSGGASDLTARLPYGEGSDRVKSLIGAPIVGWSVDPMDWKYRNAATVRSNIVSAAFDGAIVLVHDIHPTSVEGALLAIDDLKAQGYEFVTVRELFRRRGVEMQNGVVYNSCRPNGTDKGPAAAPSVTGAETADGFLVTITAGEGMGIWYTLNGNDPRLAGQWYTGPFALGEPATVRAIAAYRLNGSAGPETSVRFDVKQCPVPQLTVENGVLSAAVSDPAFSVRCTLDGSAPGASSPVWSGAAKLSPGTVVRACTVREGWKDSPQAAGWYSGRGFFFRDVMPGDWFADAADLGTQTGYFRLGSDGLFRPEHPVTRGELVTMLYRHAGEPAQDIAHPFRDVPADAACSRAVAWAYAGGIVNGRQPDRFEPDATVTRQEIAVILSRCLAGGEGAASGSDPFPPYADADRIAPWAAEAAEDMRRLGILSGDTKSRFLPENLCTNAEMAVILSRLTKTGG